MNRKSKILFSIICLTCIFLGGCKGTKEYARFAKAGSVYYAAMDNLLIATTNISLDANSERLLQIDESTNITEPQYTELATKERRKIEVINNLRKHTKLMARYYDLLFQLASTKASEQTQEAIGGVATNLNALGKTIRGSGSDFFDSSLATKFAGAIVTGIVRGKLQDEIKQRRTLIMTELDTQKVLYKKLSEMIKSNLGDTNMLRENRKVIDKIRQNQPLNNAEKEQWINDRRAIMLATNTINELDNAGDLLEKMQEAFNDLESNKLTLERVDSLLTDLETFLSVTEELKKMN